MYNILVDKAGEELKRGRAANKEELIKLLKPNEIKSIFDHEAWNYIEDLFKFIVNQKESIFLNLNGIHVTAISNGFSITTLVFYF